MLEVMKMVLKYKIVDNNEIPKIKRHTSEVREQLTQLLKTLPQGKSVAINSKDLKVKPPAITSMVYKILRDRSMPRIKIQLRREEDKSITIYLSRL